MKRIKLDKEEQEILKAFEKGKLKSLPDLENEKIKLKAAARSTLDKNKNINIRISEGDLYKIRSKAAEQGIPYQTLISSLIHQYSQDKIDYNVLKEPKKNY